MAPVELSTDGPVFSVVVPVHNRESSIAHAMHSVLSQSRASLELIVVDDGSTDGTAEVINSIDDSRIKYRRQPNRGVSSARNTGISRAEGRYVTFLDSDDEAKPNWLESFWRVFSADPACGIACCGVEVVQPSGINSKQIVLPRNLGKIYDGQTGLFLAGSFAVQRQLFLAAGGYAEELSYSENTELAMRLIPACAKAGLTVKSICEPLIVYHHELSGGARHWQHTTGRLRSYEYLLEHRLQILKREPIVLSHYYATAGVTAARLQEFPRAQRHLRSAILAYPTNWKNFARLFLSYVPPLASRVWRTGIDRDWSHS